jgi:hypothetical protein
MICETAGQLFFLTYITLRMILMITAAGDERKGAMFDDSVGVEEGS